MIYSRFSKKNVNTKCRNTKSTSLFFSKNKQSADRKPISQHFQGRDNKIDFLISLYGEWRYLGAWLFRSSSDFSAIGHGKSRWKPEKVGKVRGPLRTVDFPQSSKRSSCDPFARVISMRFICFPFCFRTAFSYVCVRTFVENVLCLCVYVHNRWIRTERRTTLVHSLNLQYCGCFPVQGKFPNKHKSETDRKSISKKTPCSFWFAHCRLFVGPLSEFYSDIEKCRIRRRENWNVYCVAKMARAKDINHRMCRKPAYRQIVLLK